MSDQRFWLCAEVRGESHDDYRGYGLLVDWGAKDVLRRFDLPVVFDESLPDRAAGRNCRGVRQVIEMDGRLHVLTQGGQLILDAETLEIVDRITHRWHAGGHYLVRDGAHLWTNSCVPDAIVRLTRESEIVESIDLCAEPSMVESLPINAFRHEPEVDLRTKSEEWIAQRKQAGEVDQLHVNTLQLWNGALYGFSCTLGAMFEVKPTCRVVFRDAALGQPHDGQFLDEGRLIVNESLRSRVVVYDTASGAREREIEVPKPEADREHPFAQHGYVRGLARLGPGRVLVGSAPLSLFEVDVEAGRVVGSMQFSANPAATCHGICAAA